MCIAFSYHYTQVEYTFVLFLVRFKS